MESIRGYRVGTDPTPQPKSQSTEYLRLSAEASHLRAKLWKESRERGANCVDRENEFLADPLPSDEEAKRMCLGCPVFDLCETYKQVARPAYGVYAGVVKGRNLEEGKLFDD